MPELPEAETIARGIHAAVAGGRVSRVEVHRREAVDPQTPGAFKAALAGRRLQTVGRRGKWIVTTLDDGAYWVTQLRMTGRFSWTPTHRAGPSTRRPPLTAQPHLSVSLEIDRPRGIGGGILRFYDVRRFARMWVLPPQDWLERLGRLGVEPLSEDFSPKVLGSLLERCRAPIRNVLLDQRRIAGIGNIYANEACFIARIDPRRAAGDLGPRDLRRLHAAIRQVLRDAVERRGTSMSDYRDVLGGEGDFQNALLVYGREGEACHRCGAEIERLTLAGRSAFYCSRCQK